jgi:hypothetical protein
MVFLTWNFEDSTSSVSYSGARVARARSSHLPFVVVYTKR